MLSPIDLAAPFLPVDRRKNRCYPRRKSRMLALEILPAGRAAASNGAATRYYDPGALFYDLPKFKT
jgi:hypothetical protein